MVFFVLRMWAPPDETDDPLSPHFAMQVQEKGGPLRWTLTRSFEEAHVFTHERIPKSIVRNVRRYVERIDRGWFYEIIRVQEDIVDTNVPTKEEEPV